MPKLIEKVFAWAVGAVALTAVTFGLLVATAKPVEASDCPYDGLSFLGQQPNYFACVAACWAVHQEELIDVLYGEVNGCCRCLY